MVSGIFYFLFLFLVSHSLASPLNNTLAQPSALFHGIGLFCHLPIVRHGPLCSRQGHYGLIVNTPLGMAKGNVDVSGAIRYVVKYASANRWAPSSVATAWQLPNDSTDDAAMPLACPQSGVNNSLVSEDCLSMILYVPATVLSGSSAPTLMWIHGGSMRFGSATSPGLDGSKLAIATNSIVAVIQYRLGALGFLSPDGATNLALKDVITALEFLRKVVPSFGGNAAKITVAGQSSGATMIRSLLSVPSASSLFQSAIIQSDPMNYGFIKLSTQQLLQKAFTSSLKCGSTDTGCLNALSIDTIVNAQENLCGIATTIDPSLGLSMPIRTVHDGSLITSTLDSTSTFPSVSKPLIISTVVDEAGPSIFATFTSPVPQGEYVALMNTTFGPIRTKTILGSSFYSLPAQPVANFDGRDNLQTIGTDYLWKCSSWSFARQWVQNGGRAYVGQYSLGATYPPNVGIPFCTRSGSVCHQDDIEIVFGTVSNPTSAQAALTAQMQKRYKAFLTSSDPNANGVSIWPAATASNVQAIDLGGTGQAPVGACSPSFWGKAVQFDFQVFSI